MNVEYYKCSISDNFKFLFVFLTGNSLAVCTASYVASRV